jgi:hypothetical protein
MLRFIYLCSLGLLSNSVYHWSYIASKDIIVSKECKETCVKELGRLLIVSTEENHEKFQQ